MAWAVVILVHTGAIPVGGTVVGGTVVGGTVIPASRDVVVLAEWALMCVAMMVPTTLPAVRHVADNSLRWRRGRATAWFVASYVAVWVVAGVPILAAVAAARRVLAVEVLFAAALLVAAAWQLLPFQRPLMRACHRTVPLPPRGWRAVRGSARFGLLQALACIGLCWPVMVAAAVVLHGSVAWMLALTLAVLGRRLAPRPSRATVPLAVGLVALAAVVAGGAPVSAGGAHGDPAGSSGWLCTIDR